MSESCYKLHTLKLNNNGLGVGGGKVSLFIFNITFNISLLLLF